MKRNICTIGIMVLYTVFFTRVVAFSEKAPVSALPIAAAGVMDPKPTDLEQQVMAPLDVKDADIQDVIRTISKGYNLNIILDKEAVGKVTVHLSSVPVIEGLQTLVRSIGFSALQSLDINNRDFFERKARELFQKNKPVKVNQAPTKSDSLHSMRPIAPSAQNDSLRYQGPSMTPVQNGPLHAKNLTDPGTDNPFDEKTTPAAGAPVFGVIQKKDDTPGNTPSTGKTINSVFGLQPTNWQKIKNDTNELAHCLTWINRIKMIFRRNGGAGRLHDLNDFSQDSQSSLIIMDNFYGHGS